MATCCFYCSCVIAINARFTLADIRRGGQATIRAGFHTDCFRAFVAARRRRPLEQGAYDILASDQRQM